jgi:hypothetical protein
MHKILQERVSVNHRAEWPCGSENLHTMWGFSERIELKGRLIRRVYWLRKHLGIGLLVLG